MQLVQKLNLSIADNGIVMTKKSNKYLLNYRLAFLSDTMVNWCPELGTVLANEEVKDGCSVSGAAILLNEN